MIVLNNVTPLDSSLNNIDEPYISGTATVGVAVTAPPEPAYAGLVAVVTGFLFMWQWSSRNRGSARRVSKVFATIPAILAGLFAITGPSAFGQSFSLSFVNPIACAGGSGLPSPVTFTLTGPVRPGGVTWASYSGGHTQADVLKDGGYVDIGMLFTSASAYNLCGVSFANSNYPLFPEGYVTLVVAPGSTVAGIARIQIGSNGGGFSVAEPAAGSSGPPLVNVAGPTIAFNGVLAVPVYTVAGGSVQSGGYLSTSCPGDTFCGAGPQFPGSTNIVGQQFNFSFSTVSTPLLVDPVPTLLTGASVDNSKLIAGTTGRTVSGVAADGTTQVVIQIPANTNNDQFTVSLAEADGDPDDAGSIALVPLTTGTPPTFTQGTLPVRAQNLTGGSGSAAFLLYRAPADFITSSDSTDPNITASQRTANLTITGPSGTSTVPILIYRPPVILVHGFGGGADTWDHFDALNTNNAFTGTYKIDYHSTSFAAFAINKPIVTAQILNNLGNYRKTNNIAVTRADLVAHSMGGNLSRLIALQPTYLNNRNFQSGFIHKLITLDTPHYGTEFASALVSGGDACSKALALAPNVVQPNLGALNDLSYGSAAINEINLPDLSTIKQAQYITGFAIVGTASAGSGSQEQYTEQTPTFILLQSACPALAQPFETVFGGPSDLVVSVRSQTGANIFYEGDVATQTFPGFIHTVIPYLFPYGPSVIGDPGEAVPNLPYLSGAASDPQAVVKKVVTLLNTPSTDSATFGSFRP